MAGTAIERRPRMTTYKRSTAIPVTTRKIASRQRGDASGKYTGALPAR